MTLDYLIEKYIEKTGYGMDMWSKEENATMTTVAEIIAESEVNKLNKPAVISSLPYSKEEWDELKRIKREHEKFMKELNEGNDL